MNPVVYVETTIPSYLAAEPSRDVVIAGRQRVTHEWWQSAFDRFQLFTSQAVIAEIQMGDPKAAAKRLQIMSRLPVLALTDEIGRLASMYQVELGLPGRLADTQHVAFAVHHEMDYLVTWNCAHIANGAIIRRLMKTNERLGLFTPLIVTPDELVEPA